MSAPLVVQHSYGKTQVRVSRITRGEAQQEFIELTLSIELSGDFSAAYTPGENAQVVATDSMKNAVYVLAQRHGVASLESFCRLLAAHFLTYYAHVNRVCVRGEESLWMRMPHADALHAHAFIGGGSERNTCQVMATTDAVSVRSGITGLVVLKTTGSGFAGFLRDQFTTLPDAEDRIFATSITASWPCGDPAADWMLLRRTIRTALIDVFSNQYSKSVQHTLYEMARAALAACPQIDEIEITMPNQHHLPVNLAPFGLTNAGDVFVPTSEPFGRISATIARGDKT